jgi:chromosome segregation protein
MRLKAIKLSGFKSFVDPTTVTFATNMTGIVGPNGCGKSNTIDAVRWVMGESSARYLRGDAMTDVIFNGSSERKPVGKATVELIFDNSDKTLKGEYSAYSDISVRRQVTRDGQSLYFLNGSRCRRKDITDLFLGTGLGPRSYAIIEQGMISRLIEARPEELRVYVEEAAGISRYKDRRRETESRMRRTVENLERLQDIREELERQLGHLHRQSESALKYKAWKADERQKKAQLHALKWQLLDADYREKELDISRLQNRVEEQIAHIRAAESHIESIRLQQADENDQYQQCQTRFYEIGSHIARQEQKIEHQSQMSLELDKNLAEVDRNLQDGRRALDDDRLQQEAVEEALFLHEEELQLLADQAEETRIAVEEAEAIQQTWQDKWQQFAQVAGEPARRADVAQAQIQSLQQQVSRHQQQQQRLREELSTLESADDDEASILDEEIAELEMQSEEYQLRAEEQRQQVDESRLQQEEQRKQLDHQRQRLQQLLGRKATLEALQKASSGQDNEPLRRWLENHQLARKPRLSSLIHVSSGWETAVEQVLGSHLQALLIEDIGSARHWLQSLQGGVLTLWQNTGSANNEIPQDSLLHQVQCQADLTSVLLNARTADSLTTALERRHELLNGQFWITPDGIQVGRSWLRAGREDGNEGGILARQQELERMVVELDDLEMDVEDAEANLEAGRLYLHSLEQQRDVAQREWQTRSQQLMSLKTRWSAIQARREQQASRRLRLQQDLDEGRLQMQQMQEDIGILQLQWQEASEAMSELADERDRLLAQKDEFQHVLDDCRQQSRQASERLHQAQLRLRDLQGRQHSLATAIERLMQQLQRFQERREVLLDSQRHDQSVDLALLREALQELLSQRQEAEELMQAARKRVEETDARIREQEQLRQSAASLSQQIGTQLEGARMECQALDIRRQALVEQLQDEKLTLRDILDNMPDEATPDVWQRELEEIGERIRRLGNINLAAIDEYRIQSERKQYLDAQNEDLQTALLTLESAIQKIDRETRTRFRETFDRINSSLAELFPKVFGGGHAWLDLVGDDLLTTGVAIMARPPGKKNSTIHLLSGGEKALTAIALVFSIFQLNPAPFCMLDEVDAPLDDANVGRYARLVKAMSEKVQFIYITHNKIAMEMAAQLLGVTMQEPGVSRLVSVDVEEAAEMIGNPVYPVN